MPVRRTIAPGRLADRVLERVVAQVPHHLVQVRRVELHLEHPGAPSAAMRNDAGVELQRLLELGARRTRSHSAASMRSWRVVSRRDSCSTFSMIWLTRTAFFSMMSVRCRSSAVRAGDSRSSWPAWLIAPTGLRISCAMLALSRPERGELRLLHALRHDARVLEEDQHRSGRRLPPATRSAAGSRCRRRRRRLRRLESRRSDVWRRQVSSR